jgi:hypothetical protein
VVEDEAIQVIGAEISHMTMETRSKRTIQRINYWLISVLFATRRATIKPIVIFIKNSRPR